MFLRAGLCLGANIPETFSAKKNLGCLSFIILIKSKNNLPLLSSIPLKDPASLHDWQGGPPIIPSQSGTSLVSIFTILLLSNIVLT